MANSFFKFKYFTVRQENCAMKVCTDACLFGAWAAGLFPANERQQILDIGTGTGLLSLMIAQKNENVDIDAVDIDEAAALQAGENFKASQWGERLHIHNVNISEYNPANDKLYDLIISNPPFFQGQLMSPDNKRNIALHSTDLDFVILIESINKHLGQSGLFAVLLPYQHVEYFENLCRERNLWLCNKILVRQTVMNDYFRAMLLFSKKEQDFEVSSMAIKDVGNEYTLEFRELLKDYYLYL